MCFVFVKKESVFCFYSYCLKKEIKCVRYPKSLYYLDKNNNNNNLTTVKTTQQ